MACFSLGMLEQMLIWLISICAIIAILKILVPWVLSIAGVGIPGPLMAILNIFIWAMIAIFVVVFVFQLISCLGGGLHMPLYR